jgi:hypothetical protein
LNISLLNKLKKLIGGKTNVDLTISVKEYDMEYAAELDSSIEQADSRENLVSMSMEEFLAYTPSKTNK